LGHVTLLTLWGFIGVESATTAAGSVKNAKKTIPRALILGTLSVALIYFLSSIGIMGLIPSTDLMNSRAPFVDAAAHLWGGHWHLLISAIASVVCIGTLNAWVLTSGQIALGLAQDKLLPAPFALTNARGAPMWGIITSSLGIFPLLILTNSDSLAQQITDLIDISVISFLFVYIICSFGLLKILKKEKNLAFNIATIACIIALLFCLFIVSQTPLNTLIVSTLFSLSGIPMYWRMRAKHKAPIL
jgi:APA family basic amino acid/polyamine antiporter